MRKKRLKMAFCFGLVYLLCWAVSLFVLHQSNDALLDAFHINDEAHMSAGLAQGVVRRETFDENSPALRWEFPFAPQVDRSKAVMSFSPFVWDLWRRTWEEHEDKCRIDESTLSYLAYITQINSDFKQYRQR